MNLKDFKVFHGKHPKKWALKFLMHYLDGYQQLQNIVIKLNLPNKIYLIYTGYLFP